MDTVVTALYDQEGKKTAVQLSYDEYLRLSDLEKECPLLRIRVKQIAELLQAANSSEVAAYPMPVVKERAPEPEPEFHLPPLPIRKTVVEPIAVQEPVIIPQPAPEPVQTLAVQNTVPPEPEIKLAETGPVPSTAKEFAIPIPPMLLDFLTEQDPSQKAKRLIMACAQKLSGLCGKRITLSLHKPYICLWDFDEWKTFAFGEIIQGHLYLSIEKALLPQADDSDVWVPPSGLCKKPLVRLKVDAITDDLLTQLKDALTHLTKSVAMKI